LKAVTIAATLLVDTRLFGKYPDFSQTLNGLCKAEVNVPAKTIQFILNLDSWQKLITNRSVGNFGF